MLAEILVPKAVVYFGVAAFYALHQDFWLWSDARPLVFGVLPAGLFYHAAYMVVSSLLLWGSVAHLWPAHLETTRE
jgi:hypothetical protein